MKKTIFLIFIFLTPTLILSQDYIGKVAEKVQSKKNKYGKFKSYNFFDLRLDRSKNNISSGFELASKNYSEAVDKGIILTFDQAKVATIYDQDPQQMEITIPFKTNGETVQLELFQKDIFSPDLKVMTSDGRDITDIMDRGKHYRGIVSGDNNSLVSISIFRNEISGFISLDGGNYTIGKLRDSNTKHIIYKDNDLKISEDIDCLMEDDGVGYSSEEITYVGRRDPSDCVNVYLEAGQSVFNSFGGDLNLATNFLNGVFGQSYVLYANEGITMQTSSMLVWTTPDPYNGGNTGAQLGTFQANTGVFDGDIGHLVEVQNIGGLAAGFSGICNPNTDQSLCFSGFSGTNYEDVPTTSFNVFIITHEMGHLLGSRHTHACVWNGNNTAIDGCAGFTEGGCAIPGVPAGGGTIMSYCINTVGLDFAEGFDAQPANVILNTVNSVGNCLVGCADVQIVCPANIDVDNDPGTCGAIVTFEATVTNPIPPSVITYSQDPGTVFPVGTTTVIATATNTNGTDQCTFTVTVTDTEALVINCPADITVSNDVGECGAVVTFADPVITDNCGSIGLGNAALFTSTVEPNPWGLTGHRDAMDAVFGSGAWDDVSYETTPAIDVFDANHSFIYMEGGNVSTNELLAYLSANQSTIENWVSNGGSLFLNFASNEVNGTSNLGFGGVTNTGEFFPITGSASVPGHPIFNGPNVPATGPYAGDFFAHNYITNGGTTLIESEYEGVSKPIVTELSFGSGIAIFGGLTAPFIGNNGLWTPIPNQENMFQNLIAYLSDVGGSLTVTQTAGLASGEEFPVGTTTNTFEVTDGAGNTATCSFDVTVNDTEDPTWVTPPSDLTVACDGSGNTNEFNNWLDNTFSGIDNCGSVTITTNSTGLSDDCGATGTETVTFTLTDSNNNAITLDATFTIVDTTDPTMDVAASDSTVECDGTIDAFTAWLADNGGAEASDACSGVTWTNDSTGLSDACGANGSETVTFTATDACGNFSSTTATFTTDDTTAPVIGCPGDVTAVTEDGDCGAIVNFQPAVAIDNCGSAFTYQTGGLGSGSVFPVGDTLIEFTAQDDCGNLATCTFTVTVIDDDAPVAICQDLTVILDDTGNATITADQLNFGSNDNCGVESLAINVDTFDCSNVGANQVTLTVTDIHGNTATCVATVTVLDNTAPIAVCQDLTLELGDDGTVTIDPLDVDGGSSDACGIASYELNMDTFDCSNLGNTAVILTVTDVNGNQSLCSAIVTLEDNTPPVLVCNDVTVELNQDGVAFITPSLVADIDDNCGTGAVTVDVQEVSCADIGTPVTVNVFANDGNGNSAVCSAIVTVVDLLAPEIVCPDDQVVNLGPDGTYTLGDYIGDGSATATDNCTDPVTIFAQDPAAGTVLGFGTQVITFTAQDQYGNVSTCSFELDIQEILGAGDVEDFASLVLYPNPADSKVNLSNPRQIDLNNVTIYDLTGRIVNKIDLSTMGSEITIDIATLANAIYMVVIRGDQRISTKQLIVNNY